MYNFISKKPYSGENISILEAAAEENEFASEYFLTYRQAQFVGLQVRKGESGFRIQRVVQVEEFDKKTGTKRKRKTLKYYTVFNVEQCEKIEVTVTQAAA